MLIIKREENVDLPGVNFKGVRYTFDDYKVVVVTPYTIGYEGYSPDGVDYFYDPDRGYGCRTEEQAARTYHLLFRSDPVFKDAAIRAGNIPKCPFVALRRTTDGKPVCTAHHKQWQRIINDNPSPCRHCPGVSQFQLEWADERLATLAGRLDPAH